MAKEKKLKDLGGDKWRKYSSIKAAQKAGSIYYSKSGKQMAAVLKSDLDKGQSLNSYMNEKLKGSKSTGANYKVKGIGKVRPKLRPKSSINVLEQTGPDKSKASKIKSSSRPGFDKFKKGQKIKGIVEPALDNGSTTEKKSEVNANPKNNTYRGGQRRADSTSIRNENIVKKAAAVLEKTKAEIGNSPTIPFAKALTTASRAKNSRAAAQYHSFSAKEKKLVKTLFNEGLTFKQAVAQVYGG